MKSRKYLIVPALVLGFLIASGIGWAADLVSHQVSRELGLSSTRYVATDGGIAMRIKWIGTAAAGATIDVTATGDITFTTDSSTADTDFGTTGTISVADSLGYPTWGAIASYINASSNWRCILIDVLPSGSSVDRLTNISKTTAGDAEAEEGIALKYNTADTDYVSVSIGPEWMTDDQLSVQSDSLLNRRSTPDSGYKRINELFYLTATLTGTGTNRLRIYGVENDTTSAKELLLYSETSVAGGSAKTLDLTGIVDPEDGEPMAVVAPRGYRMVAIIDNVTTTALTAGIVQVHGLTWYEQ